MIFYFSGTGNSRGIAERIARELEDSAVNIIGEDPIKYTFGKGECLGFVFPVYGYQAPEVMLRFAQKIMPGEAYTFAVATFSNVTGEALTHFSSTLPLRSGYGIKMPDNYPVLERVLETEESAKQKLREAVPRLKYVIQRLKERKEEIDTLTGENAHANTYELGPLFNEKMRPTDPFWVDKELCTHCSACEKMCPAGVIRLQEGYPVWEKENCYACMACINRCPGEAIEFGKYSKGRFRYYFKGFEDEPIKREGVFYK